LRGAVSHHGHALDDPRVLEVVRNEVLSPRVVPRAHRFLASTTARGEASADLEKRAPGVLLIWKREHPVFC